MKKPAPLSTSLAASRRIAEVFTPTVVQQLTAIEADLGGRRELVGMLVLAPLTPDLRYVLGLLGDPQNQGRTLAQICAQGNVLPGDLLKQLAGAALLRGKVLASQKIGQGIARVAEDIMTRAAPYEDACHACAGTGSVTLDPTPAVPNPSPGPCEVCRGCGKLTYRPDLERQKLAVEMAQLLPKSGGIQIAQINAPGQEGATGGGSLEAIQQLTDRLLYGVGTPEVPQAEEDPESRVEVVEGEITGAGDAED